MLPNEHGIDEGKQITRTRQASTESKRKLIAVRHADSTRRTGRHSNSTKRQEQERDRLL